MNNLNLNINEKEVLNFSEFLSYTGFSKGYAYKLTSLCKIPHSKPSGKLIFFKKSDVDSWLMRNPVKTTKQIQADADTYCTLNKI
ncbi:MAG: DNA-binding protein [Candidatus Kapabacteria bacterium]|nr:DNA-binding protein [Candidatus Kapabacteria bacterium]